MPPTAEGGFSEGQFGLEVSASWSEAGWSEARRGAEAAWPVPWPAPWKAAITGDMGALAERYCPLPLSFASERHSLCHRRPGGETEAQFMAGRPEPAGPAGRGCRRRGPVSVAFGRGGRHHLGIPSSASDSCPKIEPKMVFVLVEIVGFAPRDYLTFLPH